MKKLIIIIGSILGIIAIISLIFIGNFLFNLLGNPVTKIIINKKANTYVKKNYPDLQLNIHKANYDYKRKNYSVEISNKTHSGIMDFGFDSEMDSVTLNYDPTLEVKYDIGDIIRSIIYLPNSSNYSKIDSNAYISLDGVNSINIVDDKYDTNKILNCFDKNLLIDINIEFFESSAGENVISECLHKIHNQVKSLGYNVRFYNIRYNFIGTFIDDLNLKIAPTDIETGKVDIMVSHPYWEIRKILSSLEFNKKYNIYKINIVNDINAGKDNNVENFDKNTQIDIKIKFSDSIPRELLQTYLKTIDNEIITNGYNVRSYEVEYGSLDKKITL